MHIARSTIGLMVAATVAAPAFAGTTTFAQFSQKSSARSVAYGQSGASNSLKVISAPVSVNFSVLDFGPTGLYNAKFTVVAGTTSKVQGAGGNFTQPGWSGVITFMSGSLNLLTVQFSGATLNVKNGSSASLIAAVPSEFISYGSDVLAVSPSGPADFALGLSGFSRSFSRLTSGAGKDYGRSFNASVAGTFAGTAAVPEPATWLMLIAGFGMIGLVLRRRRAGMFA